jgi:hypothetical protein
MEEFRHEDGVLSLHLAMPPKIWQLNSEGIPKNVGMNGIGLGCQGFCFI